MKLLLDGLPSLFWGESDKFIPPIKVSGRLICRWGLYTPPHYTIKHPRNSGRPETTSSYLFYCLQNNINLDRVYKHCLVLGDQVLWGLDTPTDPLFPLTRNVLWGFPVTMVRLPHQSTNFFVQRRDNSLKLTKSSYRFHRNYSRIFSFTEQIFMKMY